MLAKFLSQLKLESTCSIHETDKQKVNHDGEKKIIKATGSFFYAAKLSNGRSHYISKRRCRYGGDPCDDELFAHPRRLARVPGVVAHSAGTIVRYRRRQGGAAATK